MNSKIIAIVVLGTFVSLRCALSQTNDVSTNQPVAAEVATNSQPAIVADTSPVTSGDSGAGTLPSDATPTPVAAATSDATTNAPEPGSIPLIQFQDVPITTAIENLARQAGINYLLDPKIGYNQPDQNGQIKPEPTLSIRWENITAEHALLALLDNYGLQLIEDRQTGIARITTKDPAAPPPLVTRVVQIKYASTSNMVDSVEAALTDKRSRVLADIRTSQLVVVATEPEQEAIDTLVDQLDKPTRQVLIETRLVEISSSPTTTKGIDWSGTLQAQNVKFGNNALPSIPAQNQVGVFGTTNFFPATQGVIGGILSNPSLLANTANGLNPSTMFLNADGVSAVLSFLNSSSDAQVVSTPRVVTLDNETATISVTRGFPVFNVTASTAGVSTGSSSVGYTNVGTVLEVTPHISANDYIWLKVVPDVSSFFATVTKTIAGQIYQADEFDTRHIETQVLIPNANTLVMGGLVKDNPQESFTKVPFLGDIPVLGYAFRSENKTADKDNLLIFITPTIVKDTDFQPTETQFLQTHPIYKKPVINPNSIWEGSKPLDWSNPKNTDPDQQVIDEKTVQ